MLIFSIMKRLLIALSFLTVAGPLIAADEDGDPGFIPSYQELVREGYGPRDGGYAREGYGESDRESRQDYYLRLGVNYQMAPKPTQAYYANGYTVYYGYTTVANLPQQPVYAFGYPVDYFRHMLPDSLDGVDLSRYAVQVPKYASRSVANVAQNPARHAEAITTVQSVTPVTPVAATSSAPAAASTNTATAPTQGTNPLPAVGEKPPQ